MTSDHDNKIAEMTYGDKTVKCLAVGVYRGFQYAVMNIRGNHPCGYVNISGHEDRLARHHRESDYDFEKYEWIECHGGVTYCRVGVGDFHGGYWVGWDYNHFGDCSGIGAFSCHGTRHCTREVMDECKRVIDQLCEELEKKEAK